MNTNALQKITELDHVVYEFVTSSRNISFSDFFMFITNLGDPKMLLGISAAIILLFWLYNKKSHTIQFMLSMLAGAGTVVVLKHLVLRERPVSTMLVEDGYSFPSGHALIAAVFFPVLIYIGKRYIPNRAYRIAYVLLMLAGMFAIGFSRLYLGVHYLSDVVGGILIGVFISGLSILVTESIGKSMGKRGHLLKGK